MRKTGAEALDVNVVNAHPGRCEVIGGAFAGPLRRTGLIFNRRYQPISTGLDIAFGFVRSQVRMCG